MCDARPIFSLFFLWSSGVVMTIHTIIQRTGRLPVPTGGSNLSPNVTFFDKDKLYDFDQTPALLQVSPFEPIEHSLSRPKSFRCIKRSVRPLFVINRHDFHAAFDRTGQASWLGSYSFAWVWMDKTQFNYHNFTHFAPHEGQCVITINHSGEWVCRSVQFFRESEGPKLHPICVLDAKKMQEEESLSPNSSNQSNISGNLVAVVGLIVLAGGIIVVLLMNRMKIRAHYTSTA